MGLESWGEMFFDPNDSGLVFLRNILLSAVCVVAGNSFMKTEYWLLPGFFENFIFCVVPTMFGDIKYLISKLPCIGINPELNPNLFAYIYPTKSGVSRDLRQYQYKLYLLEQRLDHSDCRG